MIKKAYMQGEIEVEPPPEDEDAEEEHSTSPRNVGHNIYILAHQVSDIIQWCTVRGYYFPQRETFVFPSALILRFWSTVQLHLFSTAASPAGRNNHLHALTLKPTDNLEHVVHAWEEAGLPAVEHANSAQKSPGTGELNP